jgi:hypothetical protein
MKPAATRTLAQLGNGPFEFCRPSYNENFGAQHSMIELSKVLGTGGLDAFAKAAHTIWWQTARG